MNYSGLRPWMWGAAVLLTGFPVLLAFWLLVTEAHGVGKGLFDYRSATWGDALFLPLLVLALASMNCRLPPPAHFRVRMAAGLLGFIAGVLVIAVWTSDPAPVVNWTMPKPRQYNDAGRWHNGYVVGCCSLFAWFAADFFHRLRRSFASAEPQSAEKVLRSGFFAVAVAASLSYIVLAAIDSSAVGESHAGLTSLFALFAGSVLLVVVFLWAVGKNVRFASFSTAVGIVVSAALLAVIFLVPKDDLVVLSFVVAAGLFGLCVALTATVDVASKDESMANFAGRWPPSLELLGVPSIYISLPIVGAWITAGNYTHLTPLLVTFVLMSLSLLGLRWWRRGTGSIREDYRWIVVSLVFVITTASALPVRQTSGMNETATSVLFALLATLLAGPAINACKADADKLMELENSVEYLRRGSLHSGTNRTVALLLRFRLVSCALATIASILGLTILTALSLGWNSAEQPLNLGGSPSVALGIGVLAIVAVGLGFVYLGKMRLDVGRAPRAIVTGAVCAVGIGLAGWAMTALRSFDPLAAFQSLCVAAFAGQCIWGNGLKLGLVKPVPASRWMLACVTVGISVAVYSSITVGVGVPEAPTQVFHSLGYLLVSYVLCGAVAVLGTATIFGEVGVPNRPILKRAENAVQDMLMLLPMWLLLVWLPRMISAHVPEHTNDLYRWSVVGLIFVGFLSLYIKAMLWINAINDAHVGQTRRLMGLDVPPHFSSKASQATRIGALLGRIREGMRGHESPSADERTAIALSAHTAVQNSLALCLVVFTLLGAFWLIPSELEEVAIAETSPPQL